MEKTKGEKIAILEMRKHIAWYLHGLYDSARLRANIFKTHNKNEIINLLEKALI
jgi:tRNA-dihydrouridine synthase